MQAGSSRQATFSSAINFTGIPALHSNLYNEEQSPQSQKCSMLECFSFSLLL
jgi:hypothetical protein